MKLHFKNVIDVKINMQKIYHILCKTKKRGCLSYSMQKHLKNKRRKNNERKQNDFRRK